MIRAEVASLDILQAEGGVLVHLHALPEGLDLDLGTPPGGEQD